MKNNGVTVIEVVQFLNRNETAAAIVAKLQDQLLPGSTTDADIAFALGDFRGRCCGILDATAHCRETLTTEQMRTLLPPEITSLGRDEVSQLFEMLAVLAKPGILHRFRRCALSSCNRWMFSKRDDQQFHPGCRERYLEEDPHAKERRKEYSRYKYQMELSSAWRYIPAGERPTFEQWLQHNEPRPLAWVALKKSSRVSM